MNVSTPAIILRTINYLESSKIVYAYTKNYGKQTLVAKGARRNKSKFGSTLEIGSFVELKYTKKSNREMFNLNEADFIGVNFIDKLDYLDKILFLMMCEAIFKLDKDENPDEYYFNQVVNLLSLCNSEHIFNHNMFIYSQLELAKSIGHSIFFRWANSSIIDYSSEKEIYVDISNCKICLDNDNLSINRLKFLVNELILVKEIASGNMELLIDSNQFKRIVNFFECYFSYHTDHRFNYNSFELINL